MTSSSLIQQWGFVESSSREALTHTVITEILINDLWGCCRQCLLNLHPSSSPHWHISVLSSGHDTSFIPQHTEQSYVRGATRVLLQDWGIIGSKYTAYVVVRTGWGWGVGGNVFMSVYLCVCVLHQWFSYNLYMLNSWPSYFVSHAFSLSINTFTFYPTCTHAHSRVRKREHECHRLHRVNRY